MVYADGVVRVRVEKVIVGVAEVPLSTYKIQYVRKALNTFIAWPTPLVNLVSDEVLSFMFSKLIHSYMYIKNFLTLM